MSRPPYPLDDLNNPLGEEETLYLKTFEYDENDDFEETGRLNIHMWCHNQKSDTCLARVTNFRVYCCLELPSHNLRQIPSDDGDFKKTTYEPENFISWDEELSKKVFESLCHKLGTSTRFRKNVAKEIPFDFHYGKFRDIYYYTGKKKPYLYVFFDTLKGRNDLLDTIKYPVYVKGEGYMQFVMHENKITTTRRMMSKQKCKYTKWFKVKGKKVPIESSLRVSDDPLTEYIINYETMEQVPDTECRDWFVCPKIMSWDGEMYSKNHKQMPNHRRLYDELYLISVVFQYMNRPETMRKYCLIHGECDENDPLLADCEVIKYETERDLLIGFARMFRYLDPDMVMGYNTSSFDYPYLIGRFERNDISVEDIPNTGRLKRDVSSIFELNWSSSGAGKNNIVFLRHKGRIPFDLLPNIKRLYKLRKYTMEYVCQTYLGEGKHPVTAKYMFETYEAMWRNDPGAVDKMTKVAAYCVQDSILPIKLFDNRKLWYHLSSLSSAAGVSILELFTRGEQIRCYSNIADECYKQGIVLSNPQYFDYYYKGGFVAKPIPGVYKYVYTLDFSSLYPSIMQAYNLSIDSIIKIEDWPRFPEGTYESIDFEQEEPFEALSASYRKDLEDKYLLYMSNYPIKFTQDDLSTLYHLGRQEIKRYNFNPENSSEDIDIDPEDLTQKQTVIRRYEVRVIRKVFADGTPGYEGIMPLLERKWVGERKLVKKDMKKCENIEKYKNYNKEDFKKIGREIEDIKEKMTSIEEKIKEIENSVDLSENLDKNSINKKLNKELDEFHEKIAGKMFIYELRDFTKEDFDKNKSLIYVYDASQKAVKVMANSGYGFNGVPTGMLPALPVAICTTALGRKLIGIANDVLTKKFAHLGAKVVYNDTDSSMVCLDINDEDVLSGKINLQQIADEMEYTINGRPEQVLDDGTIIPAIEAVFRSPLTMECENCCQMCPLKPKYYIKAHREMNLEKIKKNGPFKLEDGKPELTTKGILTSKKGNSQFANVVYDDLVNKVIFMDHIVNMLNSLSKRICDFLSDRFDPKDLCRVTELGSNYANENYFMNVFANNLTKLGMPVKPGERLEYLIVRTRHEIETGKDENVGNKCREFSLWDADPLKESIDYCYYIEKGLEMQFDYLFYVGNLNIISDPRLSDLGYKPQFSRCHGVHFSSPIKMIASLIRDYMKLSDQDFAISYMSYGFYYDPKYPRNHYIAFLVDVFVNRICNVIMKYYPLQKSI
uniref:DNA-directed DNA polymerase n=1 Tax=viral metagenome TaxID=1070528 RepID=A0A6C0BE37_9ZZZZ